MKERPKAPIGDKMAGFLRPSIAPNIVGFDREEILDAIGKQAAATTINRLLARHARLSCGPRSSAFAPSAISLRAATAGRKTSPVGEGAKAKGQILRQIDGRFAEVGGAAASVRQSKGDAPAASYLPQIASTCDRPRRRGVNAHARGRAQL